ncbi:hypothetical protein, partial [Sphingomonas bacterium]|uniref:hypothetical protein n=1 Tax=Sphingomonas bacterium TaxID=1895847 RepID=UPI001C2D6D4C
MTETRNDRTAVLLWTVLLTAASTGTTVVLACMTPFAALAAIAATRMSRREGVTLMVFAWAASQAIGFGLLGYPHDATTIAWGAGLGAAAVASVLALLMPLVLKWIADGPVPTTATRLPVRSCSWSQRAEWKLVPA